MLSLMPQAISAIFPGVSSGLLFQSSTAKCFLQHPHHCPSWYQGHSLPHLGAVLLEGQGCRHHRLVQGVPGLQPRQGYYAAGCPCAAHPDPVPPFHTCARGPGGAPSCLFWGLQPHLHHDRQVYEVIGGGSTQGYLCHVLRQHLRGYVGGQVWRAGVHYFRPRAAVHIGGVVCPLFQTGDFQEPHHCFSSSE